eukprot:1327971-Pyramimonas_sp.AAC.1
MAVGSRPAAGGRGRYRGAATDGPMRKSCTELCSGPKTSTMKSAILCCVICSHKWYAKSILIILLRNLGDRSGDARAAADKPWKCVPWALARPRSSRVRRAETNSR